MDLRSVSNPTVASRMNQLDSSKDAPTLRDVAGPARTTSLSNSKIEPRFVEMLERFGDGEPVSNAATPRFGEMMDHAGDLGPRFGDMLDIESNLATRLKNNANKNGETSELEEKFTEFVGQTLFGSMLASMRKTLGTPAYMHGGRTEEVFQQQLDQVIVEDLTEASADSIAAPMFDLFNMQKRS
jgi:peptidoglycan hydrolase FlgJ